MLVSESNDILCSVTQGPVVGPRLDSAVLIVSLTNSKLIVKWRQNQAFYFFYRFHSVIEYLFLGYYNLTKCVSTTHVTVLYFCHHSNSFNFHA